MSLPQDADNARLVAPQGTRAVALIFYGRREFVSILEQYLQKNLRDNGGLLDAVIFAIKTDCKADLDYLDDLLRKRSCYSTFSPSRELRDEQSRLPPILTGVDKVQIDWWSNTWGRFDGWVSSWGAVSEPDTIYIKIDDDVETEPSVKSLVREDDGQAPARPSWRASQLPSYTGPQEGPSSFAIDGSSPAPFKGHRWLPVRHIPGQNSQQMIIPSPASTLTFDALGPAVKNWATAAQAHCSLLNHLEQGDTWRYKFNTWNFNYERLAINFFAIRGRDIINSFPFPTDDDEEYLTRIRPQELGRPVVVDGTSLVSHFAFAPQRQPHGGRSIMWTDLLARYRGYAEEKFAMDPEGS